jgi:hypothetical protein
MAPDEHVPDLQDGSHDGHGGRREDVAHLVSDKEKDDREKVEKEFQAVGVAPEESLVTDYRRKNLASRLR